MGTKTVDVDIGDGIAVVTMDDGKANALSLSMWNQLNAAIDEAETSADAIVLTGRNGIFSGGFDLKVLGAGHPDSVPMMMSGFQFARRLLALPKPIVMAVNGHAYAMGLFLMLAGDYRIGVDEPVTLVANEVAIGMTLPMSPVAICRASMTPSAFRLATNLATEFDPQRAVAAGILHEVVEAVELMDRAAEAAKRCAALDQSSYAATKLRTNASVLAELDEALEADAAAFAKMFPT
jgi:enoyl-CoA hydratase